MIAIFLVRSKGTNIFVLCNKEFCTARFFYKKIFYKKLSLKNPKTLRKYFKNRQPQMAELQFLKPLIFPRAL